ncbi:MAG TPA: hypothetical protein GXZ30_12935 [Propionibacterium sp.]|nr:hypothetical protein [Propionibacterium sp.]
MPPDRCGHWPQTEHAEECNRLGRGFLARETDGEVPSPRGAGHAGMRTRVSVLVP